MPIQVDPPKRRHALLGAVALGVVLLLAWVFATNPWALPLVLAMIAAAAGWWLAI